MNPRPPGYEPDELPDCSTPRYPSKALRSDGKNNYSTFRRACQPVRQKFPDTLQRARPPARTVRAAPVVPPPTSQSRGTAPAKPSRQKISIAVVPPAPPTSQSRGTAPAERRKSPRPQNRPDAKPASSPPAPHFARKRRGCPAAAAPSFAGDQALILRMAIAVTCVGAALVPAVALS